MPFDAPVTTPVPGTTVAIELLELLHVPPGTMALICVSLPWHRVPAPVIDAIGFTVTTVVVIQLPVDV